MSSFQTSSNINSSNNKNHHHTTPLGGVIAGVSGAVGGGNTVSTKLTYPCTECNFEAQSARQLSRHKAITHTQNALRCVLCPFVTAYQTNLLRHRKDVHGICGSKGNKSCKFCGFVSEDNDALIHHQIEFHQDILKSAQVKFAKELVSAGGEDSIVEFSSNFESMSEGLMNQRITPAAISAATIKKKTPSSRNNRNRNSDASKKHQLNQDFRQRQINNEERSEFEEFWQAGFIDNDPYAENSSSYYGNRMNATDHQQNESGTTSRSSTPKSHNSNTMNLQNNNNNSKDLGLPATRIRRQYNCHDCPFRTINPREFLYHKRDVHEYRIKIVECPYCVYACQYVQKLQRHLLLVHKLSSVMDSADSAVDSTNNPNPELSSLLVKRKYKRTPNKPQMPKGGLVEEIEDNNGQANDENDDEQADYERITNFEMNLDEYGDDNDNNDESLQQNENLIKEMNPVNSQNNQDEPKSLLNLECLICKLKFADTISAQKHFIKYHKNHKNVAKENKNDASNSWLANANQKKVFDSTIKNIHICNFCGYKTRWISELERHIRVHSKEKPFKCPYCDFRSKWKGDLNRHLSRYHGEHNIQAHIDMENQSDTSMNNGGFYQHGSSQNSMSPNDDQESFMAENGTMDFEMEMDDCEDEGNFNEENPFEDENESNLNDGQNSKNVLMYKCSFCEFMCQTASRFHVHYVQHLNTKPFQCSVCGHRSNWEWDVTKHIKMKMRNDPGHEKAQPVLIHDSGKRDYSKYNRFVIWVGPEEAELANQDMGKFDFRGKKIKLEDGEMDSSLLTPEVCFEIDNDIADSTNDFDFGAKKSIIKSVIISRHPDSQTRKIKCSQCDFSHHFARVIAAHMSSHFGQKPYQCKHCSFKSNWRHVVTNHLSTYHKNCDSNDFEMHFRCLIDQQSKCRFATEKELAEFELSNKNNAQVNLEQPLNSPAVSTTSAPPNESNSSLIEPNLYEEKAVFRCELCPFITTNHKKMTIHCRFHNPSKGSLKCKYCPYFVNNREKLIRHQKLHQQQTTSHKNFVNDHNPNISNDIPYQHKPLALASSKFSNRRSVLPCPRCSFQANNVQILSEHVRAHHSNNNNNNNEYNDNIVNPSMLEQTMSTMQIDPEGVDDDDDPPSTGNFSNTEGLLSTEFENEDNDGEMLIGNLENPVSLVEIDDMKNGQRKKFSYVCPDCPAAFKSPGDYKIHAVFHSSNYQHSCSYCTYKARNKQQLCKHLYVHTAEYIAKRANSYPDGTRHLVNENGPPAPPPKSVVNQNVNLHSSTTSSAQYQSMKLMANRILQKQQHQHQQHQQKSMKKRKHRTKVVFPMKPVKVKLNSEENGKQNIVFNNKDLMGSQEFLETKEYLQRINSGIKNRCMYRCSKCPAVFTKVNTLIYHMSLHEVESTYTCTTCSYSSENEDSLNIHSLLHNLTESQSALGYNFNYNCHKCPAGFSKRTRLEKHLSLHGAKFNWKCDKCDYSVRYAATLVKHRALHLINPDFQAMENNDHNIASPINMDNNDRQVVDGEEEEQINNEDDEDDEQEQKSTITNNENFKLKLKFSKNSNTEETKINPHNSLVLSSKDQFPDDDMMDDVTRFDQNANPLVAQDEDDDIDDEPEEELLS